MKKIVRNMYRKILALLPDKVALNIDNLRGYHRLIDFNNPKYFGEKIQCLKLYGNLEKYKDYVDKFKVREIISKEIGEEYLVPLLGVYDSPEEIDYNSLPNQFAIKLNYGSGYNIIVSDKDKLNIKNTNIELKKWLKEDYYQYKREYQYKDIEKRILIEQFMSDENNELLDYKFYCFNGKVNFIEVDFDRFTNHTMNFYDKNWTLLNLKKGNYENNDKEVKKPQNFEKMIEIAEKLSSQFNFVRVDLYNLDGNIFFGELTFTPASGVTPFQPIEKDLEYAKKIVIS